MGINTLYHLGEYDSWHKRGRLFINLVKLIDKQTSPSH